MDCGKLAGGLRWAALLVVGLAVAFWLFMGIGEMASGDLSGASHLVPAVLVAGVSFLAWKSPLVGGLVLVALGVVASIFFFTPGRPGILAITGGPFLLGGLLFVAVAALTRPARAA
jgi:hypothetical protein